MQDNSADIIQQCKKGDLAALDIIDALLESGSDPTEYISEVMLSDCNTVNSGF